MIKEKIEIYTVHIIRDERNGKIIEEFWRRNGRLERPNDKPSIVKYDPISGIIVEQFWHVSGITHRIGGPAFIQTDPLSGVITKEYWCVDGKIHRGNGEPALIIRDRATGKVVRQEYYWLDQPASPPNRHMREPG